MEEKTLEVDVMKEHKIRGVSVNLRGFLENLHKNAPYEVYVAIFLRVKKRLESEIKALEEFPAGSRRAKMVHRRVDNALNAWFTRKPDMKKRVTCFTCTKSGCCHTNVDITEDEAKLLVEKYSHLIDHALLEIQGSVFDANTTAGHEEKIDEWGKLSFEDRKCIFLKDDRCQVYEDRPFACRKWFVAQEDYTCDDYNGGGLIQVVENAEVIASAAYQVQKSGRLPNMVKKELDSAVRKA